MINKKQIELSFELDTEEVDLQDIVPSKILAEATIKSRKLKQISASIEEVGVIEPLVVRPKTKTLNKHILLDGHLRLHALKQLGFTKTVCLIAKDDETFTYNKYVCRQAPIQEHRMIHKAIENGVSEEKIAKALNLDVKSIMQKKSLLNGICPETIELLKDKMVSTGTFHILKKMKPVKQVEIATIMIDANDFTVPFAKGLLMTVHESLLMAPSRKPKKLSKEKQMLIRDDLTNLERKYKEIRREFGHKTTSLKFIRGYINKLLKNPKIVRFLSQNYAEMLQEFEGIVQETSLR